MKKGKYASNRSAKPVALLLALVLVLGIAIGGTIAWLTAETEEVENTFTVGNIDITLEETDFDEDQNANANNYKMVPGHIIEKDPTVAVVDGSEDCWLFVQIDESATLDTYIHYEIADEENWTEVYSDAYSTVIARKVYAADDDKAFEIIGYTNEEDEFVVNKVLVNDNVTKDKMDALGEDGAVQPTLTFKAYAVQLYKSNGAEFTAAEAWDQLNG